MTVQEIIALFEASAEPGADASVDCLSPALLAACQDGELCNRERAAAEAHLANCDRCLGQLAALSRAAAGHDREAAVPDSLIARAEALFTQPAQVTAPIRWHWAVPLAAAAALLLALNLTLNPASDPSPGPSGEPDRSLEPQTRLADRELLQPLLLAPAEGSLVLPLEQVFQWTTVPGALFYDVRLVTPDGDLLLRERVDDTRWLIPESLQLEPGEEYFVRVDAYLNDAKYLSSEHYLFRVAGAQ